MKTRIVGVLSILAGVVAVAVGAWGWAETESMAAFPAPPPFYPKLWSLHWRVSSLIIVGLGLALLVAGAALLKSKRWGFVLLSVTVISAAFVPWLFSFSGFSVYSFEQPSVFESCILVAVGVCALVAYRRWGCRQ